MKELKRLKDKILSFLKNQNISVLYFNDSLTSNTLFEIPLELAIRVEESDLPKWGYFVNKVNGFNKVINTAFHDGILKFVFIGSDNKYERELLINNLENFYGALQRKYFTVCPTVKYFSILIKPTHRCNLDCKYCYDKPHREKIKDDMSMEILDRTLKLLSEYTECVTLIWHGGEPTLVGTEWYKKAYDEVFPKYPMLEFKFDIMSNGINYTEEWYDLFEKYNIKPGASYNSQYQTQLRCSSQINQNEKLEIERSKQIEDNLLAAVKRGVSIGVIDVITGLNYKNQIEIYEYYKKMGIGVCMNHIFHTKQTEINNLEVTAEEYAEEFIKFFKYWLYDKNGVSERSAEEALAAVIGATNKMSCKNTDCRYKWLGINPLGEIYPCDRYYPERYRLGTVFGFNSIDEIFNSETYQMYFNEVQRRFDTKCKECGYWFACKGDCNGCSVESTGSAEGVEEFVCELFKLKFKGIYDLLRDLEWVDNKNINPYARRMLIEKDFYSAREIKQFLKDIGKKFELIYDKDNLLECSEYQVFRGINYMNDNYKYRRDIDFVNSFNKKTVKRNKLARRKNLLKFLKYISFNAIRTVS